MSGFNEVSDSKLMGTTVLRPSRGVVYFTDLVVKGVVSEGYTIIFQIPASTAVVQSAPFGVRSFTRMELVLSPQNPSYVNTPFLASVRATDGEGRLAPLTTTVNISLELPGTMSRELLGDTRVQTTFGVATFAAAAVNDRVLEAPGAMLRFHAEWPGIQAISSAPFIVAPGPYHEFAIEVEPAEVYISYRQFDTRNSTCPGGFDLRQNELVQGCGPVVRVRSEQGVLSREGSV